MQVVLPDSGVVGSRSEYVGPLIAIPRKHNAGLAGGATIGLEGNGCTRSSLPRPKVAHHKPGSQGVALPSTRGKELGAVLWHLIGVHPSLRGIVNMVSDQNLLVAVAIQIYQL